MFIRDQLTWAAMVLHSGERTKTRNGLGNGSKKRIVINCKFRDWNGISTNCATYQAGMFDDEGVVSVRHRLGQVPWAPILSFTHITAGLSHQRLVHEITFATRFTTHSKKLSC